MKKCMCNTLTIICLSFIWIGCSNSVSSSEHSDTSPYEVIINNYSTGTACGGSIMVHNNKVYRSYDGGIAPLNTNLDINILERIGNFPQSFVYHVEIINNQVWFALTDYTSMNEVKVIDNNGILIATYEVGINPGDFASWESNDASNSSWVFVANEGNYGASNGSISLIDNMGHVTSIEEIGDVVQSLAVYKDKLIVIVNNSHKIKLFDISEDGLSLPGIEVPTANSSPREMVVINDKLYFTNWNTSDVKVLNLFNYTIETSIQTGLLPEGIITDGSNLWVTNSGSTTVSRIDINSYAVETIEVGDGPQSLIKHNGAIFISRRYYDSSWNAFHGTSKIVLD